MKLRLKKFDLSKIESDKVVVAIAPRGNGKSVLVKELLYYNSDIPIAVIVSATEPANKFYSDIAPRKFIHYEYTPELLENIIKRQKMVLKRMNTEIKNRGSTSIDPRIIVVFDDCLYDQSWVRDKNIRLIFMNGRHWKIFFVLTSQFALGIPPILRTNIDYVFICRETIVSNRKRIYDHYAGMFPTFESFCSTLDRTTENYECMIIDKTTRSNKLEDMIYWYKAQIREGFKIGASQFWIDNRCDSDEDDDGDEEFNINKFKKKSNVSLNIEKY